MRRSGKKHGERGWTRTIDPCLKRSCRTKNQQLRWNVTGCDGLLQIPCPATPSGDATTLYHNRSGMVVGTKLGTLFRGSDSCLSSPIVQGYPGPPPHVHVLGRVAGKKFCAVRVALSSQSDRA